MSTTTLRTIEIKIPTDLAARMDALSLEDKNQFAVAAIADAIRKREARERGLAEGQKLLHGPARPASESFAVIRKETGGKDLSRLSKEDLEAHTDVVVARMDPALRDELFEADQD